MAQLKNYWKFDSINELITTLDNSPHVSGRSESSESSDGYKGVDTRSYQEAHDCMLYGKDYTGLNTNLNSYKATGIDDQSKMYLTPAGMMPVVPLAIVGVPCSMINIKATRVESKIVNIIYKCDAPWCVTDKEIAKTTTELMKNIIKLEKSGMRCNVYVLGCNDNKVGYMVRIKRDGETLNIKKMGFPTISPSMLRRIQFRICERLYEYDITNSGYGSASFVKDEVENTIHKIIPSLKHYEVWNYEGKKYEV